MTDPIFITKRFMSHDYYQLRTDVEQCKRCGLLRIERVRTGVSVLQRWKEYDRPDAMRLPMTIEPLCVESETAAA